MTPLLVLISIIGLGWLFLRRQPIRTAPVGLLEGESSSPLRDLVSSRLQDAGLTLQARHQLQGVPGVLEIPESPLPKNLVSTLYAEMDGVFFSARVSPDQMRLTELTLEVRVDLASPLRDSALLSYRRVRHGDVVSVCPEVHDMALESWPQKSFARGRAGLLSEQARDAWRALDLGFEDMTFDLKHGTLGVEVYEVDATALEHFDPGLWLERLRAFVIPEPPVTFADLLPDVSLPLTEQLAVFTVLTGWWPQQPQEHAVFAQSLQELLAHDPPPPLLEDPEILGAWYELCASFDLPAMLWLLRAYDASHDKIPDALLERVDHLLRAPEILPEHTAFSLLGQDLRLVEGTLSPEVGLKFVRWMEPEPGMRLLEHATGAPLTPVFWDGARALAARVTGAWRASLGALVADTSDPTGSAQVLSILGMTGALARAEVSLRAASSLTASHVEALEHLGAQGDASHLLLIDSLGTLRAAREAREALAAAHESLKRRLTVGGLTLDQGADAVGALTVGESGAGDLTMTAPEAFVDPLA